MSQNIAIVGLGRVGSVFMRGMVNKHGKGVNLVCVAEPSETPGRAQAIAADVPLASLEAMAAMGDKVDIIFDLTGNPEVRKQMRELMAQFGNRHTAIAPESVARLIWALIGTEALPEIAGRNTGY